MPRNLNSRTTSSGSTNRSGTDISKGSQNGKSSTKETGKSTKTDVQNGKSTKTDVQTGESVKTGESKQFANVAMKISFAIKIKGRVPTNSTC